MNYLIYQQINNFTGLVTFNRVPALNALNLDLLEELYTLLCELKGKVKVLIFTGAGDKAFIAGGDIKQMNQLSSNDFTNFLSFGQNISEIISLNDWISIAAVNGYALGGGAEIAFSCDLVFASNNAKFGFPEVKLGIIPGFGGTSRISRFLSPAKGKELIFTGEIFTAEKAEKLGLVNRVVSIETLMEETFQFVETLSKNSIHAILAAKKTMNHHYYAGFQEQLTLERENCTSCFDTNDRMEGMNAFIEKRAPSFNQENL